MTFERSVFAAERLWIAVDAVFPPFVNQVVIEGEGELDETRWRDAVAAAAEANPGAKLLLRGVKDGGRWVATGPAPRVRTIDVPGWDALGPTGAPFLDEPLSVRRGPTCEIVIVRGASVSRVVLRTHHATMDGRGTLHFLEEVFRALRGEPLVGATSTIRVTDIGRSLRPPALPNLEGCMPPTGALDLALEGSRWRRLTVLGAPSRVVPKCARVVGRIARRNGADRVRVEVPADLRAHANGERTTANLTGAVFVPVTTEDDSTSLLYQMARALSRHEHVAAALGTEPLRHVPLSKLAKLVAHDTKERRARNRYANSAIVSHLGTVSLGLLSGGGLVARSVFCIPTMTPVTPFFVNAIATDDRLELVLGMPAGLASSGRLEAALEELDREFVA